MITLKQVEALHWIVELGSFERAATHLRTTQSAISKRIRELELATGHPVFDRQHRTARLTEKGEHLLLLGRELLATQQRMLDLKDGNSPSRSLRLGVTELTAITWLPRLVTALQSLHPTVAVEPEVEHSRTLHDRLQEGSLDLIVVPDSFRAAGIATLPAARVENVWVSRPGYVKAVRSVKLSDLSEFRFLVQGRRSGSGLFYERWLRKEGIVFHRTLATDSLMALVGLTAAGLGISHLPWPCFKPMVDEGKLVVIRTKPALPPVPYVIAYRIDRNSRFIAGVAEVAAKHCDFSRPLQD